MRIAGNQFTHSFIHSFIHSFNNSIHSSVHATILSTPSHARTEGFDAHDEHEARDRGKGHLPEQRRREENARPEGQRHRDAAHAPAPAAIDVDKALADQGAAAHAAEAAAHEVSQPLPHALAPRAPARLRLGVVIVVGHD